MCRRGTMSNSERVTGSHLVGRALRLEGVRYVFTLAGDHILPLLDVLHDMEFRIGKHIGLHPLHNRAV
jgi:hypothetical protein